MLPIERSVIDIEDVHVESISLTDQAIQSDDCVVIATDNESYDWNWVLENSQLVVGTPNATRSVASGSHQLVIL